MGSRVEIKASEMKQDDRSQPLFVAEPTGRLPKGFNLGVDPLCGGVGDSMFAVRQNTVQMGFKGVGYLFLLSLSSNFYHHYYNLISFRSL